MSTWSSRVASSTAEALTTSAPLRSLLSHISSGVARLGFRRALKGVSDPMSGFFLVSRAAVAANLPRLRPRGFKILLELVVRVPELRKAEVGFEFGERFAGRSKASVGEAINYFLHLWRLRLSGSPGRFIKFGLVGLSGLAVNTALLWLLAAGGHVYYLLAAVLATQGSSTWNFILAERFVFKPTADDRKRRARFLQFLAVNNVLLLFRGPVLYLFTSVLGVHYLISKQYIVVSRPLTVGLATASASRPPMKGPKIMPAVPPDLSVPMAKPILSRGVVAEIRETAAGLKPEITPLSIRKTSKCQGSVANPISTITIAIPKPERSSIIFRP